MQGLIQTSSNTTAGSFIMGCIQLQLTHRPLIYHSLGPSLPQYQKRITFHFLAIPTVAEIKQALFAVGGDKALGPDGYNALFYQTFWSLLGPGIIQMVHNFFLTGILDNEINETSIILIPKKEGAVNLEDFRPISLCNV